MERKRFAVTINKNYSVKNLPYMKEEDYDKAVFYLIDHHGCSIIDLKFEIGKIQHRLHLHLLVECNYCSIYHFKLRGFCFKVEEIFNHMGWINYIYKDDPSCPPWKDGFMF